MADSPLDKAFGGLGGPVSPAKASARPWAPPGATGPILVDLSKPAGTFNLSILAGGLLKVGVTPPNPEVYIELSKLPTSTMSKGGFGVSFWDLPGVNSVATSLRHEVVMDPPVQEMVERWTRRCLELEYVKSFAPFPDFHVPGLDIDFLDFQARGVNYGVMIRNFLLGDQMGTGKSIQMLGILFSLRQQLGGRIETLLLAPTSVVGDWHKKFLKFAKMEIAVADGSPGRRQKVYESKPEFMVISYDSFQRDAAEIVRHFRPQAIVPDEAQRITNRKSITAKRIIEFVDVVQPKFRIPMSGSPINNRADDLWPVLHLINPGLAGPATKFEGRYLKSKPIFKRGADGKVAPMKIEFGAANAEGKKKTFQPMRLESLDPRKPDEAKILDELRMKIAPHVIRRLKKDVLKDLPPKFHERLDIKLGTKERKVYEELQARFAEAMAGVHDEDENGAETTFLSWFTKAQQICSSLEITGDGDESSKIAELKDFVADHAGDEKIIIFSRFHEMTKIVCRELRAYSPLHLHGGIAQNKRQPLVDAFQEKDEHRLFVSTLKAGGVGLTLTAATIVARLDRWVAPTANEQAEDRAHRIGVKSAVTVVDFVVTDSIEERILEMLDRKLRMIASLISADAADDGEMEERKVVRALLRKRDMLALI